MQITVYRDEQGKVTRLILTAQTDEDVTNITNQAEQYAPKAEVPAEG